VLVAVLVAGRVFDRLSPLARISLVGLPLLANAVLFVLVSTSETVAGRAKLPLVFLLGATHGPANYLIYNSDKGHGDGELAVGSGDVGSACAPAAVEYVCLEPVSRFHVLPSKLETKSI
jgi:hypothetical protein